MEKVKGLVSFTCNSCKNWVLFNQKFLKTLQGKRALRREPP